MKIKISKNQMPYMSRLRYWLIKKLVGKRMVVFNTVITGKGAQYGPRYEMDEGLVCNCVIDSASFRGPEVWKETGDGDEA